ncbi:MAG: dUTP diphosphatase [Peptoniphilus harei]|uniref:Deoxyuridine 5'-triphosphate nucleotidohydrolase n=2 Tax=Peptoniphilus harei TaxID=54005 RepID=E4KYJ2_9FIRM|nr:MULTISPECIES: dUTP diphosphatase [Peptoniphilus]EFR33066.1 dUTP diphosphatase [Peptoniphilus harei ACS-146-V-Sch2b]KXA29530.1 putative dUTP diphosphatase [Peptoniphilus harei]MDK7755166.1 dUTP diphosphatase [Peptoniphilus harei]MDK7760973.1 dUTP diphosphatase [Peptoniphilus harei]MDK8270763.1 dUTP diphosphatase [Peptoniphilus harei]
MKLKVINKSKHPLPKYETEGSSGMDLRANLDENLILKPLDRVLVPTGLYFEFEKGYEAQVRARSGLALKKGLGLPNGIGTIDSDYRGELKVILINMSREDVVIEDGDRIAQVVFMKIETPELVEVEEISDTERSDGGFGHTGL